MALTKNDMARVIVQALYDVDKLPRRENPNVIRIARKRKTWLIEDYEKAHKILTAKVST